MQQARPMDLPECISNILSFTSPGDACKSSLVSTTFRSVVDSDVVWEKFLPADYKDIITRSVSPSSLVFPSKKELYFHLCDYPILIDEGNKSFALEKWSGKKYYMIGARGLLIVWSDTPAYWTWKSLPESSFAEVAELLDVCWLEIQGKIETRILSPKTTYACYLVFKFVEGAYGFDLHPTEVSVRLARGGGGGSRNVYLQTEGIMRRQERGAGWKEIEMGKFFNDTGEDGEVQMSLLEVWGGNWKHGLIIEGIEIRPK